MLKTLVATLTVLGFLMLAAPGAEAARLKLRGSRHKSSSGQDGKRRTGGAGLPAHIVATVQQQTNINGKITLTLERRGDREQLFITAKHGSLTQGFVLTKQGQLVEKTYVSKK